MPEKRRHRERCQAPSTFLLTPIINNDIIVDKIVIIIVFYRALGPFGVSRRPGFQ